MSEKLLTGEVALVTGASRGIGAAIAAELAALGATVIGTATTESGAAAIGERLAAHGGHGRVLDVSDAASIESLIDGIAKEIGAISILVNNAGITRDNLLMRMKDEDWQAILDTNLTSVFRTSKAVMRSMMKARKGRIINIASVIGVTGNAGQANYAAAKAGIIAFSKSLAREIGSRGVTVNVVAPGFIDTDMTKALPEDARTGDAGPDRPGPLRRSLPTSPARWLSWPAPRRGRLYLEGAGVEFNPRLAASWLRSAADKGHMAAQAALGELLFAGQHVQRNAIEGLMWLLLSRQRARDARDGWIVAAFENASHARRATRSARRRRASPGNGTVDDAGAAVASTATATVIASAAKQSRLPPSAVPGMLRRARNDCSGLARPLRRRLATAAFAAELPIRHVEDEGAGRDAPALGRAQADAGAEVDLAETGLDAAPADRRRRPVDLRPLRRRPRARGPLRARLARCQEGAGDDEHSCVHGTSVARTARQGNALQPSSRVTITGTWSDGLSQARVWRSIAGAEPVGGLRRQQQVVDADAVVLLPGAGLIVPEGVDARRPSRAARR